jgi:hypothetical protein
MKFYETVSSEYKALIMAEDEEHAIEEYNKIMCYDKPLLKEVSRIYVVDNYLRINVGSGFNGTMAFFRSLDDEEQKILLMDGNLN